MSRIFYLKTVFLLLLGMGAHGHLHCQYVIEWAKTYGGLGGKNAAWKVRQTSDGGYIMAGRSECNNGDLPGNYGQMDCWVMKLDVAGNIEWSRNYGGTDFDYAVDIIEIDSGYIMAGNSSSIDGDIIENNGGYDCWLLRLNYKGEIEWQKSFGGSNHDVCNGLTDLQNGYFLLKGSSDSSDGDIPTNQGKSDIFLSKLGIEGEVVWTKTFGNEEVDVSNLGSAIPFEDSKIAISGNLGSNGWVAMVNDTGTILWEKNDWGMSYDIQKIDLSPENDLLIVGNSNSFNNLITVKKLNKEGFNIIGGAQYGGSGHNAGYLIKGIDNKHSLVAGITTSTDGDISANYGMFDWWLFIIDQHGKIIWDKNFGGSYSELLFSMEPTSDGGFILGGSTSSQDHDVIARYDNFELAWIVKLVPVNTTGTCDSPKLYPNPVIGETVTIEVPQGFGAGSQVEVYDVAGRMVLQLPAGALENKLKVEIPTDWLPGTGIYFVKTNCGEQVHVLKLVRL